MKKIPFNKPFLIGKEVEYIAEAVKSGKISGDGMFTKRCHEFFEQRYGFKKVLLTTSCTDALEMTAILANILQGDEVILPHIRLSLPRMRLCCEVRNRLCR